MFNKKFLLLCLVFLVCSFLVVGCGLPTPPKAITIDDLDMVNAFVVGDLWDAPDGAARTEKYWGPYGTAWTLPNDGNYVFDCGVSGGWSTMNFPGVQDNPDGYKYAVLIMKTDISAAGEVAKVTMTLGGVEGSGKPLSQWGIDDLSTSYKTYILDLDANGFTEWGPMYFAMNQSTANTTAKIYIDKMAFANKK